MNKHLMNEIFRMHMEFMRLPIFNHSCPMSHGEYGLLKYLARQDLTDQDRRVATMAEHFHVSSPAISRMLKSMIDKQWIDRIESVEDRRIFHHYVTVRGQELLDQQQAQNMERLSKIFEVLSDEDIEEWLRISVLLKESIYQLSQEEMSDE